MTSYTGPAAHPHQASLPPAQDQGLVPSCSAWAVWLAATYRRARLNNGALWSSLPAANPSYLMNLSMWEAAANDSGKSRQAVQPSDVTGYLREKAGAPGTDGALGAAFADARQVATYLARSGSALRGPSGLTPYCDAQPPAGWPCGVDWPYKLGSPNASQFPQTMVDAELSSSSTPMPVVAKIRPFEHFMSLAAGQVYQHKPPSKATSGNQSKSISWGPSHYVVIIGRTTNTPAAATYYLVRNSWGSNWGTSGDFVVSRSDLFGTIPFTGLASQFLKLGAATPQTPSPRVPPQFEHQNAQQSSDWLPVSGGAGWAGQTLASANGTYQFANGEVPWISDLSTPMSSVGATLHATAGRHHDPTPRSLSLRAPAVPFVPALAGYKVRWSVNGTLAVASGAPVDLGGVPSPWKGVFEYWDHAPGTVPGPETGPDPDETGIYVERAKFRLVNPTASSASPPPPLTVMAEVLLPGQTSAALTRTWTVTVV